MSADGRTGTDGTRTLTLSAAEDLDPERRRLTVDGRGLRRHQGRAGHAVPDAAAPTEAPPPCLAGSSPPRRRRCRPRRRRRAADWRPVRRRRRLRGRARGGRGDRRRDRLPRGRLRGDVRPPRGRRGRGRRRRSHPRHGPAGGLRGRGRPAEERDRATTRRRRPRGGHRRRRRRDARPALLVRRPRVGRSPCGGRAGRCCRRGRGAGPTAPGPSRRPGPDGRRDGPSPRWPSVVCLWSAVGGRVRPATGRRRRRPAAGPGERARGPLGRGASPRRRAELPGRGDPRPTAARSGRRRQPDRVALGQPHRDRVRPRPRRPRRRPRRRRHLRRGRGPPGGDPGPRRVGRVRAVARARPSCWPTRHRSARGPRADPRTPASRSWCSTSSTGIDGIGRRGSRRSPRRSACPRRARRWPARPTTSIEAVLGRPSPTSDAAAGRLPLPAGPGRRVPARRTGLGRRLDDRGRRGRPTPAPPSGSTGRSRRITSEALVEAAPDVILMTTTGLESVGGIDGLLEIPGIAQTPAGRTAGSSPWRTACSTASAAARPAPSS